MSNTPTHRVSFSPFVGIDRRGKKILGKARDIGAMWPVKGRKASIIELDYVPEQLKKDNGVLIVTEVN